MNSIVYMNLGKYLTSILLILLVFTVKVQAQVDHKSMPFLGAQIFIEPGQTEQEIDAWFKTLKENNFTFCRIRMFEAYMKEPDGTWDFSLFDQAFKAGDKYDIKIFATLFPYTEKTDIGGFKFPRNEEHLKSISVYINQVVTHFKKYNSLFGWVLINEPGSGSAPDNEFARAKYEEWELNNKADEYTEKGFPVLMDLQKYKFLKDYNTWYLSWLSNEIRMIDSQNHLHVNCHAIFNIADEYDFPQWHSFLNSLGGSAHPSWHFGYFDRNQYSLAMSANSEIIRSGSGELPWIMTEIQGGNNLYSGHAPFCPTKEEIAQWLWIVYGSEAKGAIFWSLNPRSSGIEAGEWALLTLQDQPSDRLIAAKEVAETIKNNKELFENAQLSDYGINILYSRYSMWAEKAMAMPSNPDYEGRDVGAVMKSALGYFEAISEKGLNCNFKEFDEFNFKLDDYVGQTIILANQIALPSSYSSKLEHFVSNGGKLIIDGLTAFFDENLHNTMKTGSAFEKLLGGKISEFKVISNIFDLQIEEDTLSAHLWQGTINAKSSKILSTNNSNEVIATLNNFGKGKVIWIPSLVGLGSRISKNYSSLIDFLEKGIDLKNSPFYFQNMQSGMLMKTMISGDKYITIIANNSDSSKTVSLIIKDNELIPSILFSNKGTKEFANFQEIRIQQNETIVIEWFK